MDDLKYFFQIDLQLSQFQLCSHTDLPSPSLEFN